MSLAQTLSARSQTLKKGSARRKRKNLKKVTFLLKNRNLGKSESMKVYQHSLYKLSCLVPFLWYTVNFFRGEEKATSHIINHGKATSADKSKNDKKYNNIIYLNNTKNPTIVFWNFNYEYHYSVECEKNICDVHVSNSTTMLQPNSEGAYVFYASTIDFKKLPLPRNPTKVIWALLHEESPKNIAEFAHEKALNIFNFSSTFSRYSNVPFPLQYMRSLRHITSKKYFIKTTAKNFALRELSPILYMQSLCDCVTERDKYVMEFMKFQHIDSYGDCLKNRHSPNYSKRKGYDYLNNLWEENLLHFISRYKFIITIENGVCHDYMSEKFWRAIYLGVVPIYFGSPSIRDWLPNEKSAILLEDYPKPKLLSQHINKLMQDNELYEEYLEHKTMGKITNQKLIDELRKRPYQTDHSKIERNFTCFLCKKLHEKEKGVNVVTTSHYNCPKPVSALSQKVNLNSEWLHIWQYGKISAHRLYDSIMKS